MRSGAFGVWVLGRKIHHKTGKTHRLFIGLYNRCLSKKSAESKCRLPATDNDADLYELAMQVIRGDWGNGEDRRERLTKAWHDYAAVQAKVNEILYA